MPCLEGPWCLPILSLPGSLCAKVALLLPSPLHCSPCWQLGPALFSLHFLMLILFLFSNSKILFSCLARFHLLSCFLFVCGFMLFSHLFSHIREETEINMFLTPCSAGTSLSFHFYPFWITLFYVCQRDSFQIASLSLPLFGWKSRLLKSS